MAVVGTGPEAAEVRTKVALHEELGMRVVGHLDGEIVDARGDHGAATGFDVSATGAGEAAACLAAAWRMIRAAFFLLRSSWA